MTHEQTVRAARALRRAACQYRGQRVIPYQMLVRYMIDLGFEPGDISEDSLKALITAIEDSDVPKINIVDPWWRIIDYATEYPHARECRCCIASNTCPNCASDLSGSGVCPLCDPGPEKPTR